MTIAAGFCCYQGIVLGSDSEETTGSFKISKDKVAKWRTPDGTVQVAIVGTGDAVFCDMIAEELWRVIAMSPRDIKVIVENLKAKLVEIHDRYHKFSTEQVDYEVDMLIAISKTGESPQLFHAQGPSIAEVRDFCCIGYGLELGNYIATRMYEFGITLDEASVVMIYLLQQVKKYVRFCGGNSYILTISDTGTPQQVRDLLQTDVTAFIEKFETLVSHAMRVFANHQSTEEEIRFAHRCLSEMIPVHREELKAAVERRKQYLLEMQQRFQAKKSRTFRAVRGIYRQ